jgi:hypothetical protein
VKSDPGEYKDIIKKLLEKTRQRKVEWEQSFSNSFQCTLAAADTDSFSFTVSANSETELLTLRMSDQKRNTIFFATSNDLATSQALQIEQKLVLASTLLDRV